MQTGDRVVDVGNWAALHGAGGVFAFHLYLLVLPFDPEQVWARWAPDLRTHVLPCGHFLPEECSGEVVTAIRDLIAG